MSSNRETSYAWILPAALIVLLLAFWGCSSTTTTATRLSQKNNDSVQLQTAPEEAAAPLQENEAPTEEEVLDNDIPTRAETRKKVLAAYNDNNSSGFARLGKRVSRTGKPTYYPQLQHYFRTNENSYETVIQGKTKKKKDKSIPQLAAPVQESENVDNPEE